MHSKVFFSQPQAATFLIMYSGQIIGYCAVAPWKAQEAYVHTGEINIYLDHNYVGQGIGTQAINYLQNHAKAGDISNLIAGICSENTASVRLFEKAGFRQCAHFSQVGRKFGRLLDTVYLQKMLA